MALSIISTTMPIPTPRKKIKQKDFFLKIVFLLKMGLYTMLKIIKGRKKFDVDGIDKTCVIMILNSWLVSKVLLLIFRSPDVRYKDSMELQTQLNISNSP